MTDPLQDDHEPSQQIKDEAEQIATSGQDIRQKVERLVRKILREARTDSHRLAHTAKSILDGAIEGIRKSAPPDDRQNRLQQVIDGLCDGFTIAANSTRLTVEEAATRGQHFAQSDLKAIADDLKSLRNLFTDTITKAANQTSQTARQELAETLAHAGRAYQSLKPSLQQALDAIKDNPAQLAKDTTQAISHASRQKAETIASSVSQLLRNTANRLDSALGTTPPTPTSPAPTPPDGEASSEQKKEPNNPDGVGR